MASTLFDLRGKVALITGGNSGIGLGFATGAAKQGADICIWGTSESKNQSAKAELDQYGTRVLTLICDVSDEAAVNSSFAATLEHFGRVDSCFANAGIARSGRFEEFSADNWHQVMNVNLDGVFFTLRAAAAHMKKRAEAGDPGGRLIATSSLGALMGMAKVEAYAASKGAVISLMQGLAVEYAKHGITANAVLPGHIETAMTADNYKNEKFAKAILPRIPARRWGDKSDFEGIAAYLMSDASAYHTGDTFLIDGGFFLF